MNLSSRNIKESREAAHDYSLATNLIEKYAQLTNDLTNILSERGKCEKSTIDHFRKVQTALYEDALKVPPRTVNFAKFDHLQSRVQSFRNDLSYLQKERRIILSSEVSSIRDPSFVFKQHLHSVLEKLTSYRAFHPHSRKFQQTQQSSSNGIPSYTTSDRLGVRAVKSPPDIQIDEEKIMNLIKSQQTSRLNHDPQKNNILHEPNIESEFFDNQDHNKRYEDSDSDKTLSDGINEVANENLIEAPTDGQIEEILQEENYLPGYREPRFEGTLSTIEEVSIVSDSAMSRSRLEDEEIKSIEDLKEDIYQKSKPWYVNTYSILYKHLNLL